MNVFTKSAIVRFQFYTLQTNISPRRSHKKIKMKKGHSSERAFEKEYISSNNNNYDDDCDDEDDERN